MEERGVLINRYWTDHFYVTDEKTGFPRVVGLRLEYEVFARDGIEAHYLVYHQPQQSIEVSEPVQQALLERWDGTRHRVITTEPMRATGT